MANPHATNEDFALDLWQRNPMHVDFYLLHTQWPLYKVHLLITETSANALAAIQRIQMRKHGLNGDLTS